MFLMFAILKDTLRERPPSFADVRFTSTALYPPSFPKNIRTIEHYFIINSLQTPLNEH